MSHVKNDTCTNTLGAMADDSIDHVITSPPYNMNLRIRNGKHCSRQIVKEFSSKYEGFDDNLSSSDFYCLHTGIIRELLRVTKGYIFYNIAIVTGSKKAFFRIMGEHADSLKEIIVWDKGHGQPSMQSGVLNRQSELILVFSKNDALSRQFSTAQFKRGELSDTWKIQRGRSSDKGHGAVFAEELVGQILDGFTRPGDLIYDPFTGTGTTGVVCAKKGRNFVGSELLKSYCDLANQRIMEVLI